MTRAASRETLLRLAEATDKWYGLDTTEEQPGWCEESRELFRAIGAYRAETAPLRTETEVERDIGRLVRASVRLGQVLMTADDKRHLEDLANELTAPDPTELGACPKDCPECPPESTAAAAEFPLEDPPCSCDEAEGLKRKLGEVHAVAVGGCGSGDYPSCCGESGCRTIVALTSQWRP